MNQPLYTEQDNQDLNAKIEAAVKPAVEKTAPAVKIQQSTTFGTMNQKASFTEGGITVQTPNTPDLQLSPEMIRQAQAQLESGGGAVILGANGDRQMFSNLKDMFANNKTPTAKKETFFVVGKGKIQFGIDNTIFAPSAVVRLSTKSFEEKYLAQLESYIYNNQEDLDPEKLFAIIFLVGFIREGKFPIKLVTGRHRMQLPKIVAVMNKFFNKNYSVVMGIYTMFNGMTAQQPQAEQKAE